MAKANVRWVNGMQFESETGSGHKVLMDARKEVGGEDQGPRPMELLLAALGGCTGMDVVSILRKMRVEVDSYDMEIEGDNASEHPKYFTDIRITYRFSGSDIGEDKVIKAINLSREKYCSVSYMLKQAAKITYFYDINGEVKEVPED